MMVYLERPKTFSDIHISRSNSVSVNLPEGKIARISFYDKTKNDVLSFIGNYAAYSTADPENVIVSVTADGYLPYLDYGENNVDYIQNETVAGMRSYTSGTIKATMLQRIKLPEMSFLKMELWYLRQKMLN